MRTKARRISRRSLTLSTEHTVATRTRSSAKPRSGLDALFPASRAVFAQTQSIYEAQNHQSVFAAGASWSSVAKNEEDEKKAETNADHRSRNKSDRWVDDRREDGGD